MFRFCKSRHAISLMFSAAVVFPSAGRSSGIYSSGSAMDGLVVYTKDSVERLIADALPMIGNAEQFSEEKRVRMVASLLASGRESLARGNFSQAFKALVSGLRISETCADGTGRMSIYNNLGNIYLSFSDYEKAVELYKSGYALREEFPDRDADASSCLTLPERTICWRTQGTPDAATLCQKSCCVTMTGPTGLCRYTRTVLSLSWKGDPVMPWTSSRWRPR